jgi:hypothetical protein
MFVSASVGGDGIGDGPLVIESLDDIRDRASHNT